MTNRVWVHESPSYWDDTKAHMVGAAPEGTFPASVLGHAPGSMLPGDWWRVESEGTTVGYGWMDVTWGDAEMLLVVAQAHQRKGVGTYIVEALEREARARGLNYLYNAVHPKHPQHAEVTAWLKSRNFHASEDGKLARAVLGSRHRSSKSSEPAARP